MKIIVSLTTTSARLNCLRYVVYSLVNQNLAPDVICINISNQAYMADKGIPEFPAWISEFSGANIKINYVENTGPYRKLTPIIDQFELDDCVITCDDDVLYGPGWLAALVQDANEHQDAIVCAVARKIKRAPYGRTRSYLFWPQINKLEEPQNDLLPIGVGGVLYRTGLVDVEFIRDESFKKIAPYQDDLWYRYSSMLKNKKVWTVPEAYRQIYPIEMPDGLHNINTSTKKFFDIAGLRKIESIARRMPGYLGWPVTKNDLVWRDIERYGKKYQKNI